MNPALIEEAAKKSGVIWIALDRPRIAWHVWHEGAIYVVTGGREQHLPGLPEATSVRVILPSKDSRAALGDVEAEVTVIPPGSEEWETMAPLLAKNRLNATDAEHQPTRWAEESHLIRLKPLPAP
ncbi:hypothetical protein [Bailinhaonella thermotolerans]|uniref:Pyridoxamine 5'-phosphate oxidase putative domain-containing protein n=1 Tax=Bailinhaonella thermotolerans TaxID=1070861 RepID=A0A3A4BG46_9ACTN|nr:hypothetical protein [Bailinhaonella thermotolerans]RJL33462.1 hypothetical protein D5H75_11820 [Bailinhaonella thermotolerans]